MGISEKRPAIDRITRRNFLKSSARAGLGVALAGTALGQSPSQAAPAAAKSADELRVAVIGCGAQGRVLIESMLRIPSVRIAAICDIWSYSRQYAGNYLKKYGHVANVYEDYRELLAAEKGLQAAVVATPDWVHAEQADACPGPGSTSTAKKRCPTRSTRPGPWSWPLAKPGRSCRSATSAAPTRATSTPSTASSASAASSAG